MHFGYFRNLRNRKETCCHKPGTSSNQPNQHEIQTMDSIILSLSFLSSPPSISITRNHFLCNIWRNFSSLLKIEDAFSWRVYRNVLNFTCRPFLWTVLTEQENMLLQNSISYLLLITYIVFYKIWNFINAFLFFLDTWNKELKSYICRYVALIILIMKVFLVHVKI